MNTFGKTGAIGQTTNAIATQVKTECFINDEEFRHKCNFNNNYE
jgi:hypothetical protein